MAGPTVANLPPRLRRLRRGARVALWLERATVALWPALGILGGFVCLALLGVPQSFPGLLHAGLLLAIGGGLGWAVWRARAGLVWPGQESADRRLERAAGLPHRPLAVLSDRAAATGGELWLQHQRRALRQVGRLRMVWPKPALAARDPRGLRALLALGLVTAVVIAGPEATGRLVRAAVPYFAPAPLVASTEVRAWMAPPAFTGLPPSLLPDSGDVAIPADSRVTVGLTGGRGGLPSLVFDGGARAFDTVGQDSFQVQAEPTADGPLTVRRDGADVVSWRVTLRPDLAPVVAWTTPPAVLRGRLPRVRLAWKATHAYGIASLAAEFRLRDRLAAPPLSVAIPLSGRPREVAGTTAVDLTAHPWAGLPVVASLHGRDGAGLVGSGPAVAFEMPARRFRHPGAQAIVTVRRQLALVPQDGTAAAAALRHAADQPELWPQGDPGPGTAREIAAALDGTPTDGAVEAAQTRLWELALLLEEGTAQRTADALRRARQELRSALEKPDANGARDKHASETSAQDKAQIERRAQALADAMKRHQQALADQARREPGSVTPVAPQDRRAAEEKLQQLQDAARADHMDEARERMAELDQMLDEMRRAGRSEAQRKRDEGREKGRSQMSVVQDLVRRQAGQIDRAEARLAEPAGNDPPPAEAALSPRERDRTLQLALRRVLGELMQQHGDLTGAVPKNLGEADAAMREAAGALASGRDDLASASALRAVEALQKGGQQMGRQLAQKFGSPQQGQQGDQGDGGEQAGEDGQQMAGDGQQGQDPGDGTGRGNTDEAAGEGDGEGMTPGPDGRPAGRRHDPFGRATREGLLGADGGRDTRVPEEMEQARGRAVQDELRRREAQRTRPQQELDYIGRLLKPE